MRFTRKEFIRAYKTGDLEKLNEFICYSPVISVDEHISFINEMRDKDMTTYKTLIKILVNTHQPAEIMKKFVDQNDGETLFHITHSIGPICNVKREVLEHIARSGKFAIAVRLLPESSY